MKHTRHVGKAMSLFLFICRKDLDPSGGGSMPEAWFGEFTFSHTTVRGRTVEVPSPRLLYLETGSLKIK